METYLRNDEIANYHCIKEDILPAEHNTLIISEKERLFENFVNNYKGAERILKIKTLLELKTFFLDPKINNYAQNNSRVIQLLLSELLQNDEYLNQLSIIDLEILSKQKLGKKRIILNNGIELIIKFLDSKNKTIRKTSYKIFYNISKEPDLIGILIKKNIFHNIIELLSIEHQPSLLLLLNKSISNLLYQQGVTEISLSYSLDDILSENALSSSYGVLNQSVFNLLLISYLNEGKENIKEKEIYKRIWEIFQGITFPSKKELNEFEQMELLRTLIVSKKTEFSPDSSFCSYYSEDNNQKLNMNYFLNFFSSTSIKVEVKNFYSERKADELIMELLDEKELNEEEELSCYLFLSSLSENHSVRKRMRNRLNQLENRVKTKQSSQIETYLKDLIKVIKWEP